MDVCLINDSIGVWLQRQKRTLEKKNITLVLAFSRGQRIFHFISKGSVNFVNRACPSSLCFLLIFAKGVQIQVLFFLPYNPPQLSILISKALLYIEQKYLNIKGKV